MPKQPSDLDLLRGEWCIEALESSGAPVPAIALAAGRVRVTGDRFRSTGMGQDYDGRITLDDTRTPKHIDLTFTSGPQDGTRNLGIYRIDKDRWTLCLSMRDGVRPKTFAGKADGMVLEQLVREQATGPRRKAQERGAAGHRPMATERPDVQEGSDAGRQTQDLDGEWTMVSAVFDGKPMSDEMVQWCRRVTRGGETRVLAGPQTMLHAKFTIDRSASPIAIDYVNLSGAQKGKTQAGIVSLEDGVLKICMSPPGKPRPRDFSSKRADGRSLTVWTRTKS